MITLRLRLDGAETVLTLPEREGRPDALDVLEAAIARVDGRDWKSYLNPPRAVKIALLQRSDGAANETTHMSAMQSTDTSKRSSDSILFEKMQHSMASGNTEQGDQKHGTTKWDGRSNQRVSGSERPTSNGISGIPRPEPILPRGSDHNHPVKTGKNNRSNDGIPIGEREIILPQKEESFRHLGGGSSKQGNSLFSAIRENGVRDTSLDALHRHQASGKLGRQEMVVYGFYRALPRGEDATRQEASQALGIPINALTGRAFTLIHDHGLLRETQRRTCRATGESAMGIAAVENL